jgi:hypothetical protein
VNIHVNKIFIRYNLKVTCLEIFKIFDTPAIPVLKQKGHDQRLIGGSKKERKENEELRIKVLPGASVESLGTLAQEESEHTENKLSSRTQSSVVQEHVNQCSNRYAQTDQNPSPSIKRRNQEN